MNDYQHAIDKFLRQHIETRIKTYIKTTAIAADLSRGLFTWDRERGIVECSRRTTINAGNVAWICATLLELFAAPPIHTQFIPHFRTENARSSTRIARWNNQSIKIVTISCVFLIQCSLHVAFDIGSAVRSAVRSYLTAFSRVSVVQSERVQRSSIVQATRIVYTGKYP